MKNFIIKSNLWFQKFDIMYRLLFFFLGDIACIILENILLPANSLPYFVLPYLILFGVWRLSFKFVKPKAI